MQQVDLSNTIQALLTQVLLWLKSILDFLDSVIILPNLSLLKLIIIITVIGLILSAVFVLFDGGDYDE